MPPSQAGRAVQTNAELEALHAASVGFVYSHYSSGPSGSQYNLLHAAGCDSVGKMIDHAKPNGPPTFRKRFFGTLDEALSWLGAEGHGWRRCRTCQPGHPAAGGSGPREQDARLGSVRDTKEAARPAMLRAAILGVPARAPHDEGLQRGASAPGEVSAATTADRQGAYRQRVLARSEDAVTEAEAGRLVEACRPLPTRPWEYEEHDYMTNVLLTVLDLQMHNVTVERSIRHYRDFRWNEIRALDHLEDLLGRFPEDKEGNRQVARYLWGNDHWTRAGWLRGLAVFLAAENLRTQGELRAWAWRSDYQKDFAGRVRYLGPAAYHWLVMRLGVDTVKPDVHLRRFVEDVVGHPVTDGELVRVVTQAARRLGISPRELDAAIWERAALGTRP
jgi:hypothetical protein